MRTRCWHWMTGSGALLLAGALVLLGGAPVARAATAATWSAAADCAEAAALPELPADTQIDFAAIASGADMQGGSAAAAAGKECKANVQCGKKDYCAKAVGECRGQGACKERPQVCPDIYLPVCGCNGKTFGNDCWAAMAGVNVKSQGACAAAGGTAASCTKNSECKAGDFCAKKTGDCDGTGTCAVKPTICPEVVDPVCGCDGKTFNNYCYALRAGVNVKHAGKC